VIYVSHTLEEKEEKEEVLRWRTHDFIHFSVQGRGWVDSNSFF
jgi:hypothetical protein